MTKARLPSSSSIMRRSHRHEVGLPSQRATKARKSPPATTLSAPRIGPVRHLSRSRDEADNCVRSTTGDFLVFFAFERGSSGDADDRVSRFLANSDRLLVGL
jgi:hypothetical protein